MILVTGGTGLVGSHLLYELTSSDFNVKAIKRKTSSLENLKQCFEYYTKDYKKLLNKIEWVEADVSDKDSLKEALKNVKILYHCAAMVSFNPQDKEKMRNINIQGTKNIVELCTENEIRLCFVSSIASLGDYNYVKGKEFQNDPVDEFTSLNPDSPHSEYSITKFKSEEIVWEGINNGLNAVIVNPSVILGFGHWNTGSSKLITMAAKGVSFYTKGRTGYVDVRDLVKAMHLLTISNIKSDRFLLSAGNYSYQELFCLISKGMGMKEPKYYATPFITGIAWRIEKVKEIFSGKKASLTKETARSSHKCSLYNGNKIKNSINGFQYRAFGESIEDICKAYKKQ
ncbi:MAG: NAD-dependent epimerase/dehydratase family protein [Marinifilaceae bacterium]